MHINKRWDSPKNYREPPVHWKSVVYLEKFFLRVRSSAQTKNGPGVPGWAGPF
jgi:hypothetical protein